MKRRGYKTVSVKDMVVIVNELVADAKIILINCEIKWDDCYLMPEHFIPEFEKHQKYDAIRFTFLIEKIVELYKAIKNEQSNTTK